MLTSGCSTVERRTYYSPDIENQSVNGPKRPSCGWSNFGGKPDVLNYSQKSGDTIYISAPQNMHPYLWGPWFLSIVPVFPITWLAEAFVSNDLKVKITGYDDKFELITKDDFKIIYMIDENRESILSASEYNYTANGASVTFPINRNKVKDFKLKMLSSSNENSIEAMFTKSSRWSWTQWTPNC